MFQFSQHDISIYFSEHWLEMITVLLSIAGVWLAAREKTINWPIGIVASAISIYVYYGSGIYLDAWISVFYVVFGFYGWQQWLQKKEKNAHFEISPLSFRMILLLIAIGIPLTILLAQLLIHFSKSTIPYLDSITTVLSLIGTWMIAKKQIENWLVWIIADTIYVIEYIVKDLYYFAVLYFVFTILAVYGYFEWKKLQKKLYVSQL